MSIALMTIGVLVSLGFCVVVADYIQWQHSVFFFLFFSFLMITLLSVGQCMLLNVHPLCSRLVRCRPCVRTLCALTSLFKRHQPLFSLGLCGRHTPLSIGSVCWYVLDNWIHTVQIGWSPFWVALKAARTVSLNPVLWLNRLSHLSA